MIELRPVAENETDVASLRSVHAAVCGEQFSGLPADVVQQLVDSQFAAQRSAYRAGYATSVDSLIVADGEPVGRCWIDESAARLHVLDIAVVPAMRRRGFARRVLLDLIERAGERAITLEVWQQNAPALALYDSLGFVAEGSTETHLALRREPTLEPSR